MAQQQRHAGYFSNGGRSDSHLSPPQVAQSPGSSATQLRHETAQVLSLHGQPLALKQELTQRGSMHVVNGHSKRGDGRSVHHERRRDETAEGRHTRAETAATKTENARRADIANKVRSDTRTATCAGMRAQPHRAMAQHQEVVMCVWFRSGRRKTKRRKASAK